MTTVGSSTDWISEIDAYNQLSLSAGLCICLCGGRGVFQGVASNTQVHTSLFKIICLFVKNTVRVSEYKLQLLFAMDLSFE